MIEFYKYQGLGNDFILFSVGLDEKINSLNELRITRLCDRKLAIGADGILEYSVLEEGRRVRMTYFNSDGSRAETCFNGLRCIALHGVRQGHVPVAKEFEIVHDAGVVAAWVNDKLDIVRIDLPPAKYEPEYTHFSSSRELIDGDLDFPFGTLRGTTLSLGNPHFVSWKRNQDLPDLIASINKFGIEVETSSHFSQGTNFELASIVNEHEINMAVWERGAGYTLACGSGATAAICAGVKIGILQPNRPIAVNMPGGKLIVNVKDSENIVEIEGEAKYVFSGKINLDEMGGE